MEEKEREAIVRMMIYIKYELIRNNMDEEADMISKAIELAEKRFTKERG